MLNININIKKQHAFTIIELLVSIVVIGILLSITTISYSDISNRAKNAAVQAELFDASIKLSRYYSRNGSYPTTLDTNGCPATPIIDTANCIKFVDATTYVYIYNDPTSYKLTATRGADSFKVTENTSPSIVTVAPITAISAMTGTATSGEILTVGALTPVDATATYQWQSSTSAGGTYINIPGATSSTYMLVGSDENKYLKVIATGTGDFYGTVTSTNSAQIALGPWVIIGSQYWSRYNLNVGTRINGVNNQTQAVTAVEKYCYNNLESNCTTYGGLYQWGEMMQYSATPDSPPIQGICPAGSHIPTDGEWKTLEMSLGMTQLEADGSASRGTDEGTKIKPGGSSNLNIPVGGYRFSFDGSFISITNFTNVWSSSQISNYAYSRYLAWGLPTISRTLDDKTNGFYVRCLKNS